MAKTKTIFACQNCGAQSPKWVGKCPDCNQWNTFAEEVFEKSPKGEFFTLQTENAVSLPEIQFQSQKRLVIGLPELDRVFGGGIVPGSLGLIGGDPGIGKSTLILQSLHKLAQKGISVLYATGEESLEQIKLRAERLGIDSSIQVLAENSVDRILAQAQKLKPQVLVVDSIQTVFLPSLESAPGSLSQVRECAGKLLYFSKTSHTATLLIGHVTKDGSLAGPRTLEHMVDCVLYFEGDSQKHYRILRTIKNRFGSTNEIGVFEMTQQGLWEVENPSALFLSEGRTNASGSSVTAALEGARPFLVEIQALVSSTVLANPRRTTLGVDNARVALLIAVLEKSAGLNLYMQDIYVNAAGGFKVVEPAADLAILTALVSSFKNKPLKNNPILIGEVGLSGEIRSVSGLEIRLNEAHKMGFSHAILPKSAKGRIPSLKTEVTYVESVSQALEAAF